MKSILDIIKQLLKSKSFWEILSMVAGGLLEELRRWLGAKSDAERTKAEASLQAKLEEARIKRMELEVELKRREVELQQALLQLEKAKIAYAHATSKKQVASTQRVLMEAEKETATASTRAEEVGHAVTVLKKVEDAGAERDEKTLVEITKALAPVR